MCTPSRTKPSQPFIVAVLLCKHCNSWVLLPKDGIDRPICLIHALWGHVTKLRCRCSHPSKKRYLSGGNQGAAFSLQNWLHCQAYFFIFSMRKQTNINDTEPRAFLCYWWHCLPTDKIKWLFSRADKPSWNLLWSEPKSFCRTEYSEGHLVV